MKNIVIWLTGMSGSGKTTIANGVFADLVDRELKVKILDGDDIRNNTHTELSFTPKDIRINNDLIVKMCAKLREDYDCIIVSIISPFLDSRQKAREEIGNGFIEVFVYASIKTLVNRDVKGLYKKALSGDIDNFIGINPTVPYEPPEKPNIHINTEKLTSLEAIDKILNYLK